MRQWLKRVLFEGQRSALGVLREGRAMRIIFYYPGEEGTYVDDVDCRVYENGIVQIISKFEDTTAHIQNCEVLWKFSTEGAEEGVPVAKVRLIKQPSSSGPGQPEPTPRPPDSPGH